MNGQGKYRCGTLSYTKAGLVWLFACLLWGDFCFTVMQSVVPSVLPVKLKALGASDLTIMLIVTALPSLLGMTICPCISFKSDRFRSSWGRRIPFIVASLPFLVLSLIALGCGEEIALFLQANLAVFAKCAPATAVILTLGAFMVAFMFFDMFVGSVFWYIFNDVVPPSHLGRFIGCFRIVGGLASAFYNYFIFKYAEHHMREIFIGAALLYLVGIGMMCFYVKEGEYPPVNEEERRSSLGIEGIATFFRESFSIKFYWTKYLIDMFGSIAMIANTFMLFFYEDMGLAIDDVGKANGTMLVAAMASMYFASIFVDRWHPLRIMAYSSVFIAIFQLAGWVWLFVNLPPSYFFWLYAIGICMLSAFHNQLYGASTQPLNMRLHPKSRFGQFCSAQALVRSLGVMIAGLLAGACFDILKGLHFASPGFAYRFCFAWTTLSWLAVACCSISLYRQWMRRGGDFGFHPPAPWTPEGVEEQEQTPYVGPQSKWLKIAFLIVDCTMIASLFYLLAAATWTAAIGWKDAALWHLILLTPWAIALCAAWFHLKSGILADMSRCASGQAPLDGIPHHGVIVVMTSAALLLLIAWMALSASSITLGMKGATVVFGVASLIGNTLMVAAIELFRIIERQFPPMLDYDGRIRGVSE